MQDLLKPAGLRALMQSAADAGTNATSVATAEELMAAVVRGDQHIVIQSHLDLTSVEPLSADRNLPDFHQGNTLLDQIPVSVDSIRVRSDADFYDQL